jgi:predicted Holliday junction resolvase-like endonuclease
MTATFLFLLIAIAIAIAAAIAWATTEKRLARERVTAARAHAQAAALQQEVARERQRSHTRGGSLTTSEQHHQQAQRRIRQLEEEKLQMEQRHKTEMDARSVRAVAASRGSFNGHIAQQAFPISSSHSYHPKDIFHLGGIIDYVVFDGLHDIRHAGRDPQTLTVVFADVKWGNARATDAQDAVIRAMNTGRTRGETWHGRELNPGELTYKRKDYTP